jgi:cobalt-zinc-cadmium resistance protein CzcA
MIDAIVSFSIRQRWLVMIIAFGMAALGAWNFTQLPIDAVPDITNVQVEINTSAAGYSPLEVEQRITFPMETASARRECRRPSNAARRMSLDPLLPMSYILQA